MTPQLGNLIYPTIGYVLEIKDRLDRGADPAPDIETEQRAILARLLSDVEARRMPDYGGDGAVFLGARYILACWIDEIFIVHSPWGSEWNDRKLEVTLYNSNDRAWKFWEQADIILRRPSAPRAPSPPGADAVEAVLLCLVLGFRGKYLENPTKLKEYVDDLRPQATKGESWQPPPDRGIKTDVEPLTGGDALRHVFLVYGGLSALATLAMMVVYRLFRA